MPHIRIDCSDDIFNDVEIQCFVDNIHQSVIASGLFKTERVKTRCFPTPYYCVGEAAKKYIHVEIRIRPGRNVEQKRLLSNSLRNTIVQSGLIFDVVTIEVNEIDMGAYVSHNV
ncbi:MAG: hypothetical protein OEY36_13810 [Gammaproteobacteria bacterium]|nr:hypothetical protein [Gammaproteobacteria bacterium]